MKITSFTGGIAETHGYLIETSQGNILIDAPEGILRWLQTHDRHVSDVLLTHQHYDHVIDAAALQISGAKLHAFAPYSQDLTLESAARSWGMPLSVEPYTIDHLLLPDQALEMIGLQITISHLPGHASDSLTFYLANEAVVFSGDTLFSGSIGRTDLPGGSTETLLQGIRSSLMKLPSNTRVLPGHGPETTIGYEATHNPFL
ncbi:MAG: MBL fold metallo-hydrolase [Luteolibacter sp.]